MFSVCNLTRVPYTCCYSLGIFGSCFKRGFVCLGKAVIRSSSSLSAAAGSCLHADCSASAAFPALGSNGILNALEKTSRLISYAQSFLRWVIKALVSIIFYMSLPLVP